MSRTITTKCDVCGNTCTEMDSDFISKKSPTQEALFNFFHNYPIVVGGRHMNIHIEDICEKCWEQLSNAVYLTALTKIKEIRA